MTLLFLPDSSVQYYTSLHLGTATQPINNFSFALYTANYAPVLADTLSTYNAIECSLTGYFRQTWVPSNWVGGVTLGIAAYAASAVTFLFSAYGGGTTIYGVYLVITDSGASQWLGGAQLLGTPYTVPAFGGNYALTPTFNERSE